MNYLESVTYIFKDKHWPAKIGLAALVGALSFTIVGWIAADGWYMQIFRRAIDDADEKLPGWEHWRTYLRDGLKYFGVSMIWLVVGTIINAIVGWPSWVTSIPIDILMVGAMITLVRTGDFGRALNPVNAWKSLKPYGVVGLLIIAAIETLIYLWGARVGSLIILAFRIHYWRFLARPLLIMFVLDPWSVAITSNLYGRLYRQSGADIQPAASKPVL